MKPKRRRPAVFLAVFLSSVGLWHCGVRSQSLPSVAIEAHSEALALWLERGIKGATLIHIDAHDDLREIRADRLVAIEALAARRDFDGLRRADSLGADGLYHEGNFVTAALRLGVVRNVVWGIPGHDGDSARAVSSWAERRSSKLPLKICSLEMMPDFPGPVLLSIDLDFLPEFAQNRGLPEIEAARRLVQALGKMASRWIHVVVSYSTGDSYTPILLRWLGNAVLDMLRAYPSEPSPASKRLWAFLQKAEGLRRAGEYHALVNSLKTYPSSWPAEARLLYLADAYYLQNELESSFEACRDACLLDKRAAAIFFWVAKGLAIEDRVDEAARFLDAGRATNAAARDWQAEAFLALALQRAGREGEALTILERLASAYASFSAEFLIGGISLENGDRLQAGRHFDEAVLRLDSQPDLEVDLPEIRAAIVSAVRFYESVGQTDKARRVKNDARFRAWFR